MPAAITDTIKLKTQTGNVVKSGVFTLAPTGTPGAPFSGKIFDSSLINQGASVAISADGKTAIIGSPSDGVLGSASIYILTTSGWARQGPKLVGSGALVDTGPNNENIVSQGYAVAISADGNTAAVGGPFDGYGGAVWIFKRSNGVWSQFGGKISFQALQGGYFGSQLAISADGNTIIGGGRYDSVSGGGVGYIYSYINGIWTPQFTMFTDSPGLTNPASAVAISADGNTAVVGSGDAYSGLGAAFIFIRNGNSWVQQGNPLSGAEAYYSLQGTSVSLSADGNTLVMGAASAQLSGQGATWVFTRTGGIWAEQAYLVASTVNPSGQGNWVSVSADGNVALVSGSGQNAAWLFTKTDSTWTKGVQLNGTNTVGSGFGSSIALSATGNAAIVGSPDDNGGTGAVWFFNSAPTAVTMPASNITKTGAILNGIVNDNQNLSTVTIQYDTVATMPNPVTATLSSGINPLPVGTGMTRYSSTLSGLDSGMTYYYRIKAAYAGGTTQGNILSFTTPGKPPVITAFSPDTAPIGTLVTINGTGFNGTSQVLFGNVSASSYKIVSSNTIQAYVGSGASGNIIVATLSGTATHAGFKFITILPSNNFSLTVSAATCIGANDGSVSITAQQPLSYTATISGNDVNQAYQFTDSLNIHSLAAANYSICISTSAENTLQQCFNIAITQPPPLSVFAATNATADSVKIIMSGGTTYFISLNGLNYRVNSGSVTLPLIQGSNQLQVSTDKLCQGTFTKNIMISNEIAPYPVPFQNTLNLNLGNTVLNQVGVVIYNVGNGRQVYFNQYNNISGVIQFDLSALKNGIYALHFIREGSEKIFKVIKE